MTVLDNKCMHVISFVTSVDTNQPSTSMTLPPHPHKTSFRCYKNPWLSSLPFHSTPTSTFNYNTIIHQCVPLSLSLSLSLCLTYFLIMDKIPSRRQVAAMKQSLFDQVCMYVWHCYPKRMNGINNIIVQITKTLHILLFLFSCYTYTGLTMFIN